MNGMHTLKYQTVERNSIVVHLDFRSKLLMIVVISFVAFVWESPIALAGLALLVVAACRLSGVRPGYIRFVIKVMIPFYLLLVITHGFWNIEQVKSLTGKSVLTPLFTFPRSFWLVGGASLSLEGFLYGSSVIFKTLVFVMVFPLAIFTTEVDNMIVSLVRLHIPYKFTFIFSSALRFFPLLFEEMQAIIEAQRLRGLAVEKMRPFHRVRHYARAVVPLILGAMARSQQLEIALQSKAFTGSSKRTYLHEISLHRSDYVVMGFCTLFLVMALVLYFRFGVGTYGWLLYTLYP